MKKRLDHLDGVRGIAALSVVVFHLMSAFTPWLVPEQQPGGHWIGYSPVAVVWNGSFAVSVFFVLSGFVVANATLRRSDPLWLNIVIRYLRLAVPATLSVLFAWILLGIWPDAARQLDAVAPARWLQWTHQAPIPGLVAALQDGLVGIFRTGGSSFNNVLWTMRPELIGSILCFIVCLFGHTQVRIAVTVTLAVAVFLSGRYEYECFVLGILLREAWAADRLPAAWSVPALLLGLMIGSQSGDAAERLGLAALPGALDPDQKGGLIHPIGAALIVYGTMRFAPLTRALSSPAGKFLGAISFPLYLLHVPLIYTLVASLHLASDREPGALIAICTAFMIGLIGLAYLFERCVDRPFLVMLGALRTSLGRLASIRFQSTGVLMRTMRTLRI